MEINHTVLERFAELYGFTVHKDGRVNHWGIRTPRGQFNDVFFIWWYDGDIVRTIGPFLGTTEPGNNYLESVLGNKNGTAVLVHNKQYKDCWTLGMHKGKYQELQQSSRAKFEVWRDNNKNGMVDYGGKVYNDVSGLQFHSTKAGYVRKWIGGFSSGCQLDWDYDHFVAKVMPELAMKIQEFKFQDYTLILEETLIQTLANS